jgi:hypothetical protein
LRADSGDGTEQQVAQPVRSVADVMDREPVAVPVRNASASARTTARGSACASWGARMPPAMIRLRATCPVVSVLGASSATLMRLPSIPGALKVA